MWLSKSSSTNFYGGGQRKANAIVAVAIDKDKYSQHALKWAIEQLLTRDQTIVLVHVNNKTPATGATPDGNKLQNDKVMKDLFLPFRCFCTRKHVCTFPILLGKNKIKIKKT
ncbi:putative rossmann-like alpha/beta/alpha sandwich protein [Helianthus debilis subsp. tardiflorus]